MGAMLGLIWKLFRLLLVVLVLGVALYLGGPLLLGAAGRYLISQDPVTKADVILVLSGQPFLRVPEAARLYHEGIAPTILLSNAPRAPGLEDLLRAGIRFPDEQEISLQILGALRVPPEAIRLIRDRCETVQDEIQAVARFLKAHPAGKMIIVTSKSRSVRIRKIFAAGLDPTVSLIVHPVPSDPFDPARWWQDPRSRRQVFQEYEGLADFWRLRLWHAVGQHLHALPPPVRVR